MKLTDCYYEKKDWRACKAEVRFTVQLRDEHHWSTDSSRQMELFRECWKKHSNDVRTSTQDV
jgi:cytochrome c oxidase assembly factor 4